MMFDNQALPVGLLILMAAFLAVFVYAIVNSKKKWKTVLFTLVVALGTILLGYILSLIFPDRASLFGELAVRLACMSGASTSSYHAYLTKKANIKPPEKA
jgi:uncharacterized membrane protein YccC